MRNIITSIIETTRFLALDFRDACSRHFSVHYHEREVNAFMKVPFIPVSLWIEFNVPSVDFGFERTTSTDAEFFLGKVRGVVSIETKAGRQMV